MVVSAGGMILEGGAARRTGTMRVVCQSNAILYGGPSGQSWEMDLLDLREGQKVGTATGP